MANDFVLWPDKQTLAGLQESMAHMQAALSGLYTDAEVSRLLQAAAQAASEAQLQAAKNLVPISTIHKQAMQRGISSTMATWQRTFGMHSCQQAYVVETDGTTAKYYDVETEQRNLCVSCGLPYDGASSTSGNIHFSQYMVQCPMCGCGYQVSEYKGERSFRENGIRVFWCSSCYMLFDREATPAIFLNNYTKEHVDPQMSKKMFEVRTAAWKQDMDEACEAAREDIYGKGIMSVNQGATHTSIHIHQEAKNLQEKWDSKVAASKLKVSIEENTETFEWDTWQPDLSTTYTVEELEKKLQQIGKQQQGASYLKNNATGSTEVMDADLERVLSQEHTITSDILYSLGRGEVGYDNAIRQLYAISEAGRRQGRPEYIESEALEAARLLETMHGRVPT